MTPLFESDGEDGEKRSLGVSPVICQLQGQLDKGIRTYLLRFGVGFPKLMKDCDDDIQVFDHSAMKERGCVPSPVAACCFLS